MSLVTVLQPDVYQGTIYSAPQAWESGKTRVTAKGLLSDEDLADATKHLSICIEQSFDGGNNYSAGSKAGWTGNTPDPLTGPGAIAQPNVGSGYSGSNNPPTHVRIRFDLPQSISIGGTVNFM